MSKWQQQQRRQQDENLCCQQLKAKTTPPENGSPDAYGFSRRNIHEPKKIPYNIILFDTVLPARPASFPNGR
jgi:hypothetical protein